MASPAPSAIMFSRCLARAAVGLVRTTVATPATRFPAQQLVAARFLSSKAPMSKRFKSVSNSQTSTPKGHPQYDDDDEDDEEDYDHEWDGDEEDWSPDGHSSDETVEVGLHVPFFEGTQLLPSGETSLYRSVRDMENRFTVMLFYPADFTFVCPTELVGFSDTIDQFEKLDCDVIGISTDQIHSHVAWTKVPKNEGGIKGLKIPLLADPTHEISKTFGVYNTEAGQSKRATVIVDKDLLVVHQSVNHDPIGRSVEETLRIIKALTFVREHGDQACPASWKPGKKTITTDHDAKVAYFSKQK